MPTVKIAVTIDKDLLARLDRLVEEHRLPSRSRVVQEAIRDKLRRLKRTRLARECAKLNRQFEQKMADEGLTDDARQWPEY
jgi:metal-responsive CopG/Arc/MetJ family transcriptional regulator